MLQSTGFRIAFLFLLFILILKLLLMGWQKVSIKKSGNRFNFVLTNFPFKKEISWRDVKYFLIVIVDSLISLLVLFWILGRIF